MRLLQHRHLLEQLGSKMGARSCAVVQLYDTISKKEVYSLIIGDQYGIQSWAPKLETDWIDFYKGLQVIPAVKDFIGR